MTWWGAIAWTQDLVYYDSVRGVTYSDWRLPATVPCGIDYGIINYNCTASEMGHLFYSDLGGLANSNKTGNQTTISGVAISDIQTAYWSGTEFAPDTYGSWYSFFSSGGQTHNGKIFSMAAWAVRPGDVIAEAPTPDTVWLLGIGLACLCMTRRRRGP